MRRTIIAVFLLMMVFLPATITRADPIIGGCQIFPADNPWNTDISNPNLYPVHPNSANYIANINSHGGTTVHPDFGQTPTYGIPYNIVPASQPTVPMTFRYVLDSDPGPYPIPPNALIEDPTDPTGDHHVIVLQQGVNPGDPCTLYEMWDSTYNNDAQHSWDAGSGAIFHLDSNTLRPDGNTSADAAGLPILPGLARCDEAMSGEIKHALRFTVEETQSAHVYPATHDASNNTGANFPPMGLRLRLKASFDLSIFNGHPQSMAIAQALKTYGMILADNGSNWYISGAAEADDPNCWDDNDLNHLKSIPGTAFEVISPLATNAAPARNVYSTGTPTFTWNRVTDAAQYHLQVSGNPAFTGAPLLDTYVNADKLYYGPAASFHNGTYYWRVQACPGAAPTNCGAWSAGELFSVHA